MSGRGVTAIVQVLYPHSEFVDAAQPPPPRRDGIMAELTASNRSLTLWDIFLPPTKPLWACVFGPSRGEDRQAKDDEMGTRAQLGTWENVFIKSLRDHNSYAYLRICISVFFITRHRC